MASAGHAGARCVHVAAGVLVDSGGRVLVTRRHPGTHQGGLWEFPGGKLMFGEAPYSALVRELHEELGIHVARARPLIRIRHRYGDRTVILDVWRVAAWRGVPFGREGQPLRWEFPEALDRVPMPAADKALITALRLPSVYLITPHPEGDPDAFFDRLEHCLRCGIRIVQLRAHGLGEAAYADLAQRALALCRRRQARLLLNCDPEMAARIGADGVHLTSARLAATVRRPLAKPLWVAASCHDQRELWHASRIDADFALLSPVKPTRSHGDGRPLGWPRFAALVAEALIPVYALGGMKIGDLEEAWRNGAQGVAAVSSLWNDPQELLRKRSILAT